MRIRVRGFYHLLIPKSESTFAVEERPTHPRLQKNELEHVLCLATVLWEILDEDLLSCSWTAVGT